MKQTRGRRNYHGRKDTTAIFTLTRISWLTMARRIRRLWASCSSRFLNTMQTTSTSMPPLCLWGWGSTWHGERKGGRTNMTTCSASKTHSICRMTWAGCWPILPSTWRRRNYCEPIAAWTKGAPWRTSVHPLGLERAQKPKLFYLFATCYPSPHNHSTLHPALNMVVALSPFCFCWFNKHVLWLAAFRVRDQSLFISWKQLNKCVQLRNL